MTRIKRSNSRSKGITLIELLVGIGILIILAAMSALAFRYFQRESDLNNSTKEIIAFLRLAQNKTLASEGASQYGVFFNTLTTPHEYILFKGSDYTLRDTSFDEIHKLPKTIEIYEIDLQGGSEVVFDRLTGTTSQSGSVSLRLISEPSRIRTIYIEGSGQVGLTSPSIPSDADRVKDSRHVHFDLGWSIKDAITLKFDFVSAGQIKTINMADYFNVGETEFDWEGTFSVGGVDQVFHIHTHSLDAFNTLLCIHRDRNNGKTDQEVVIYIVDAGVDKEIAHYLADPADTVNEGPIYGGTKEIQ